MTIEKIACPVLNHHASRNSRVEVFVKFETGRKDHCEPTSVPVAIMCPYYNPTNGNCGVAQRKYY